MRVSLMDRVTKYHRKFNWGIPIEGVNSWGHLAAPDEVCRGCIAADGEVPCVPIVGFLIPACPLVKFPVIIKEAGFFFRRAIDFWMLNQHVEQAGCTSF